MSNRVVNCLFRSFLLSQRVFTSHNSKQFYCRWASRRPSKVILPKQSSIGEEQVIDLTEHYEKHNSYDNEPLSLEQDEPFIVRNPKIKQKHAANEKAKIYSDRGSFDLDQIDAETVGLDLKKIKKKDQNELSFKSRRSNDVNLNNKLLASIDVFDSNEGYIYEKLPYKDATVGNRIIKLRDRRNRSKLGEFFVEGWRLIGDGLQAGCQLDTLIFSRLEDLEHLRPFMPKKGVKIYKMPYKEMQMWSYLDTCPGLLGIFKTPTESVERRKEIYPINVICDNIRDPGNLGSIMRTCLGIGCNSLLLTKGCVDIWDNKVLRSAGGAHFRMSLKNNLNWENISEMIGYDSTVLIADNNTNEKLLIKHNMGEIPAEDDSESSDEEIKESVSGINVPIAPYYKLDYSRMPSMTLIVGGETEGVSDACYKFALNRSGIRVNIPLADNIDSLNSSMCLGIIGFEMKKQIIEGGFQIKQEESSRSEG